MWRTLLKLSRYGLPLTPEGGFLLAICLAVVFEMTYLMSPFGLRYGSWLGVLCEMSVGARFPLGVPAFLCLCCALRKLVFTLHGKLHLPLSEVRVCAALVWT